MEITIESMKPEDWPVVQSIYAEGILSGMATFETEVPDWDRWNAGHLPCCRLAARGVAEPHAVMGWAALSPYSSRAVYAGVAGISIYIRSAYRGLGIGRALMERLVIESEAAGIWTLQAAIFADNHASLRLHRAAGFREVGRRERIACLQGVWRDTILVERRSAVVGV